MKFPAMKSLRILSYGELDGIDRKPEVPGMGRRWSLDRWDYLARQSRAVNSA
jgi:hypothetical protein